METTPSDAAPKTAAAGAAGKEAWKKGGRRWTHSGPAQRSHQVRLAAAAPVNPSSVVQKTVTFYGRDLLDLRADFRHYIADFTGALGQAQPEVSEQLGGGGLGGRDDAQAQLGRDLGAAHRDDYVHAFDPGDLLD